MAVCEMRKVYIIGDRDMREGVIKRLSELGVLQIKKVEKNLISGVKQKEIKTDDLEENLSRLSWTIGYLRKFERAGAGLGLFPNKVMISRKQFFNWTKNFAWKKICDRCSELHGKSETLREERKNLLGRCELLLPWGKLPIPLKKLQGTKLVAYQLGIISSERSPALQKEMTKLKGAHLHILKEDKRKVYFLLAYLRELEKNVESLFQEIKMEKVQFEEFKALPGEELRKIRRDILRIDGQLNKIREESKRITQEKIKLMALYDYFYNLLQERKATSHTYASSYTFTLEGWIRKEDIQPLSDGLKDYPLTDIVVREPSEKEEKGIPVALSNKRPFRPFELVTELYGIPRYFEIDPTPFLAPFFALFLALCLTDGGYGIILALLAYLIPKKIRVGKSGERLFSILFISGLITIVVGTITGGMFGIQFSQLPPFFAPLKRLTLFNPIKQPMVFLAISLALGVIHLLIGITLAFWEDLKRGDIISAILDHLSWIVLILGVILFGLSKLGILSKFLATPGLIMFLSGAIILFIFAGRKSKSLFVRLGKGAYELYGLISLFGDVLSYSRLLALGLATSVIATVVNIIANMAWGIPFIGPVGMILILILGHLGNIAINTLSGFIHTARLQFVEFFGKFYEGGGGSFTPFKQEGKYTIMEK
jgi:V/A-type H+-transporting ATPase subunit I